MSTVAPTAATDPYAALATSAASSGTTSGSAAASSAAGTAESFLKLLVTQMQNQDPLNPMDNAQITSQIAQINTVSGIQQLNTTVTGLNSQFLQMQALQGASLVGHEITVQGNKLQVAGGSGSGGFDLAGAADSVKVQIVNPAGLVVDTVDLGAQSAGNHDFSWPAGAVTDASGYTFKVAATSGAASVVSTPLMFDHVTAVSTTATGLVLETQKSGDVAYSDVKAFN
jgi:flagellar basal-body rod modification protein FlgD